MSPNSAASYKEKIERLDQIVEAVRSKDTSLEHSLDLLDEAIALGLGAVELVDSPEFAGEEPAPLQDGQAASTR